MSENEEINETMNEELYDESYPDKQVHIESDENNADIIPDESVQNETEESIECSTREGSESIIDDTCTESESDSSDDITGNSADESAECTPSEESATPEESPFESLNSHIDEVFNELNEKFDALNKQFSDRIARSENDAKIIKNMDSELKAYKDDLYKSILKPLILELIDLRENILKLSAFYLKKPEGEQAIPNATFADYAEDISDILEKYDVEIIKSASGDECLPLKHRILKAVPTDNESLHKKIAESFSSGYIYNGRVIFPERVNVYKFEAGAVNADSLYHIDSSIVSDCCKDKELENKELSQVNASNSDHLGDTNSAPCIIFTTTKSYGIKAVSSEDHRKYIYNVILKDMAMPSGQITSSERFCAGVDNQRKALIEIFESDSEDMQMGVDEELMIGSDEIILPDGITSSDPITITFSLDTHGMLKIYGEVENNGSRKEVLQKEIFLWSKRNDE